jgi:2-polyprenyl-3-methyl-5-hydroxy-6-metoxy-1,4-benzoquinol methylase
MPASDLAPPPTCPCGERATRRVIDGRFRRKDAAGQPFAVFACTACDLGRTAPVPDATQYARAAAHSSGRAAPVVDGYAAALGRGLAVLAPGGTLLDVGCSTGDVVAAAAAAGMRARGIDPDPRAIAVGRSAGRAVEAQALTAVDGRFDVILMNHALEHVHDPDAFLRAARERLALGGRLVVNVPNRQGWPARLMRDQWAGWLPAEHVFHYTPRAMRALAARTGLRVERLTTTGVIEPPSTGARGAVKLAVARAARAAGHGDEIACVLVAG